LFIPAVDFENAVSSVTESILFQFVCSWTRFEAKNGGNHAAVIGGNSNGNATATATEICSFLPLPLRMPFYH
jgi:hypothetical protein